MITFDESFSTQWVIHSHDDELIQEYIVLKSITCVPFYPESSLSDVILSMQDILLEEIASRFISVAGSVVLNEAYQAYFFNPESQATYTE